MAVVKPFRALRYDEAVAGPLETLVAPPYDVISPEQRDELRTRSPYNVVRLTLPDSEDEAARELEDAAEPRRGFFSAVFCQQSIMAPNANGEGFC